MKHIFLLTIFALSTIFANAQIRPLIEEGKTWANLSCTFSAVLDEWVATHIYIVGGDSIVNGTKYKVVYHSTKEDFSNARPYFFAREDNGKIYILFKSESPEEFLYFDYNAKIGETLTLGYINEQTGQSHLEVTVTDIDNVILDGSNVSLKRFTLSDNGSKLYFYEGVGYEFYGLEPTFFSHSVGGEYFLICCHDGEGTQLYGFHCDSGKYKPVSGHCYFDASMLDGISTPTVEPTDSVKSFYNIDGRKLPSKPSHGVYIENGKKRMAR